MLGDPADPGAFPPGSNVAKLVSRQELFQPANPRVKVSKKGGGSNASRLRGGALVQVAEGRLNDPVKCAARG